MTAPEPIDLTVEGQGSRTVVMVHGWPDTGRLWDAQVEALQARYRCVRFTLPGFNPRRPTRAYSLDEVVACIAGVVDQVSPHRPVTLMLHDWGCFYGYQYAMRHRDRVERVIGVDIGDAGSRYHRQEIGWRGKLGVFAYQLWLALAWRIGGETGDSMARWMARRFHAPARQPEVVASQGYPYAVQWFGVAGGFGRLRAFSPTTPMCFVYGERKPFMFHSSSWIDRIRARPGCKVQGFPTGHWVMSQRPTEFNALILDWLHQTDRSVN